MTNSVSVRVKRIDIGVEHIRVGVHDGGHRSWHGGWHRGWHWGRLGSLMRHLIVVPPLALIVVALVLVITVIGVVLVVSPIVIPGLKVLLLLIPTIVALLVASLVLIVVRVERLRLSLGHILLLLLRGLGREEGLRLHWVQGGRENRRLVVE